MQGFSNASVKTKPVKTNSGGVIMKIDTSLFCQMTKACTSHATRLWSSVARSGGMALETERSYWRT
jgi:hypothetical protein